MRPAASSASALNANATAWRCSPAATEVEHVAINWLKEMLGYPEGAAGLFTSGGSMANMAGLAAARTAKAPVNVVREGMAAAGRPMCVYVSAEGHFSIGKAAGILGIGETNVRSVRTDGRMRMDMADLERLVGRTALPAACRSVWWRMREPPLPAPSIPSAKSPPSPAGKICGCTWMRPMAASRYWPPRRDICLTGLPRPIRLR